MKVSIIASAVREPLYKSLMESLEGTSVEYEVVFAGNVPPVEPIKHLRYIKTEDIKPSQCYEISRRAAKGKTIIWAADDCEFHNDIVGKAYKHWKEQKNYKLILSLQTSESGYGAPTSLLFDMKNHCFFGSRRDTPLMAPLALISKEFLIELGGFDRRYLCGQYENDVVMNAYVAGGVVEIFGNAGLFINIDHIKKSIEVGESKEPLSYSMGNVPASVSKETMSFGYTAEKLLSMAQECGNEQSLSYFNNLIFKFKDVTKTVYKFKYSGASQESNTFVVTLLPNKVGYFSLAEFKQDFDQCYAGGDAYPTMLNNDWLLFVNSCGSGFDDGSGNPHGCDEISEIVKPTLQLN